ncbi:MAG: integral rane protein-like protein [Acidobacteriales bacterium]|nr:integral rane protein-like protein [Terriglobales bacterium]
MSSHSGVAPSREFPQQQPAFVKVVFGSTIFLSAFLLFQIQLLMAKFLLPWFGGAAAVWTTCMLFFQVLLLGGYAYAHFLSSRFRRRTQFGLHVALLAASLVMLAVRAFIWNSPITPDANWKPINGDSPISGLLALLSLSIGLPFLLLSATSPLLQRWLIGEDSTRSDQGTYKLYALSNVGSMLGLLSYPFVVEPHLRLATQARLWSAGFGCFSVLCALCAKLASKAASRQEQSNDIEASGSIGITTKTRVMWFTLALCGSLMLLATTNLICQDLGVVPLLWVFPLSVYLLTFILCFGTARIYRRELFHPAYAVVGLLASLALLIGQNAQPISQIYIYSLTLFIACMVCHGELSKLKPDAKHLTSFYLTISAGGAAGGTLVGVIAPLLFREYWEYHIGLFLVAVLLLAALYMDRESWIHTGKVWVPFALALAFALLPGFVVYAGWIWMTAKALAAYKILLFALLLLNIFGVWRVVTKAEGGKWELRFMQGGILTGLLVFGALLTGHVTITDHTVLAQTRNFYGVLFVNDRGAPGSQFEHYELLHGRTAHGIQLQRPEYKRVLTSYYTRKSGVGLAILNYPRALAPNGAIRIGAVGLGVGTISAYARPGDLVRFYEINPQVIKFALGDKAMFSYLESSAGRFQIVRGDARVSLERELSENDPQNFDILVLDAFSSDAIPVHLLTREALQLYMKHLRSPESVIAIHVSNKALDLAPVVAGLANDLNFNATFVINGGDGGAIRASEWILLSQGAQTLNAPEILAAGLPLVPNKQAPLWTDDYSDLLSVLKH